MEILKTNIKSYLQMFRQASGYVILFTPFFILIKTRCMCVDHGVPMRTDTYIYTRNSTENKNMIPSVTNDHGCM